MAVITLDSGVFCHADEIAAAVAGRLGYRVLTEQELLAVASERSGLASDRLAQAMHGPPPLFSGLKRDREKVVAHLRSALAEAISADNLVHAGPASMLLPASLSQVLKVCLAATRDYRIQQGEQSGRSRREAEKAIKTDDEARAEWTQHLFDTGPWEKSLYDIFLPMHEVSIEQAVATICENAQKPQLLTTAAAVQALADLQLACAVEVALADKGHDVEVQCSGGVATILIKNHAMFLGRLKRELVRIAAAVPGVSEASARPGPRYREPHIVYNLDFEAPSKVLLVDDEKEFVTTLSERLQARDMTPAVAYDGAGALALVEADEPEVMVLDLKMPGIDGLEVLRRVKQQHRATEVIILTGHGSEAEENLAAELGAFAYLRKPVDIELLTSTMKAAYHKVQQARRST